ncbi:hypothetical protein M5D96_011489 [Drosophila gunungcola]|uniref:Uncharacterized protein n=1 Tax=Drosophila gunungcola TaxID=103775 RepID=A0A9P9YEX6_9MUSC|nr:hypothetical protein M5D96_011489 [Drosophila gunungcola]
MKYPPRSMAVCVLALLKLTRLLVLLDGGLHQRQVLAQEALESAVGPGVGGRLLLVLVGALLDVGLQRCLVLLALAQLRHQIVHLEALGLIEQVEFDEDTLDVVAGDLVLGIVEGLVLGDQGLGHLAGGAALLAHILQILGGAEFVLGGGGLDG